MIYDEEYYEMRTKLYKYRYFTDLIYAISNMSKYAKYYVDLCENILLRDYLSKSDAKKQTGNYIETHHIVPHSIDATYSKSKNNLIHRTLREHFVLHKLLSKMFVNIDKINHMKMLKAVTMFKRVNGVQNRSMSSRDYEYIRKCYIKSFSGEYNPMHGRKGTVLGKKCYTNGIVNKFFKENEQEEGFYLGSKTKGLLKHINNGEVDIRIGIHDDIPEGFVLGSVTKGRESPLKGRVVGEYSIERKTNISIANSNKMWITDGERDERISIFEEIPNGWNKGRSKGNSFSVVKVVCNICNNYTSNSGNVAKHKRKCSVFTLH